MKRFICFFLLVLIFSCNFPLEAQGKNTKSKKVNETESTVPTEIEPSWQLVVGGAPVGNPIVTEYGFAVPLEGRTMAAVSQAGKLMWFAGLPGTRIAPHSSTGNGDFLITVSGGNSLSLINPSGLTLWSSKAPAEIISQPVQGRDGRIYVQCPREVACFGINGILKWSTPAGEAAGFPLIELEDGSILHIQRKTLQGCTTALRYSPFGLILEEITFSGKVTAAIGTKYGALLFFSDGGVGCISSTENKAKDRWVLPSGSIGGSAAAHLFLDNLQTVCAVVSPSGGQTTITYLNPQTGELGLSATAPIDTNRIAFGTFDYSNLVLCDTTQAVGVSLEGEIVWESDLPGTIKWSHILYLPQGYLAMLEQGSWIISAYRVTQHIGTTPNQEKRADRSVAYPVYVQESARRAGLPQNTSFVVDKLLPPEKMQEIQQGLANGEYNDKEGQWLALTNIEMTRLFTRYSVQTINPTELPFFDQNVDYFEEIVKLMASFESGCFNKELAQVIRVENDPIILAIALQGAARMPYDPTFELLESIEVLLSKAHLLSQPRIAALMCDATYEICRFMGKPALFTKGRSILSFLLNQNLDSGAKVYAAATMRKIITLGM